MNGEYCYSWNGECYHGEFNTEQEALEAAKTDRPYNEEVWIGTATEPSLIFNTNEDYIIESLTENLYDQCGEFAENFTVSEEDEKRLGEMLKETVERWIEERKITPSCFTVLDGRLVGLN